MLKDGHQELPQKKRLKVKLREQLLNVYPQMVNIQ